MEKAFFPPGSLEDKGEIFIAIFSPNSLDEFSEQC